MPCTKCKDGKYKWGKTGSCKYANKGECEKANPKKYNKMRPTPIGKKTYEEYAKELKEFNLSADKFELGLVQDGEQAAEQLLDIADELSGIKKEIARDVKRIDGYDKEGFSLFKYLDRTIREIEKINKELGITTKIPALSKMEKAKVAFNNAQKIKI
tara:strand:- start:262 stop:732 length:471 start_codon:yes stop_codon:yes gene_type:complete